MAKEATHYCEDEDKKLFCYDVNKTAKRCYINKDKTRYDYCKSGWEKIEVKKAVPKTKAKIPNMNINKSRRR